MLVNVLVVVFFHARNLSYSSRDGHDLYLRSNLSIMNMDMSSLDLRTYLLLLNRISLLYVYPPFIVNTLM